MKYEGKYRSVIGKLWVSVALFLIPSYWPIHYLSKNGINRNLILIIYNFMLENVMLTETLITVKLAKIGSLKNGHFATTVIALCVNVLQQNVTHAVNAIEMYSKTY